MSQKTDINRLIEDVALKEGVVMEDYASELYDSLHRIAKRFVARHRAWTLDAKDLVHEAFIRLAQGECSFASRCHFECGAACAMRRVLIDRARSEATLRRGGAMRRIPLANDMAAVCDPAFDILTFNESLERLEGLDPEAALVVELRCFGGLEHAEIARVTRRSLRSVERAWRFAKSWLEREMEQRP